jgi:hypothetical protein
MKRGNIMTTPEDMSMRTMMAVIVPVKKKATAVETSTDNLNESFCRKGRPWRGGRYAELQVHVSPLSTLLMAPPVPTASNT